MPFNKKWLQGRFDSVLPARSWEMPVEHELPAKIGQCYNELLGHNFDARAKSSWKDIQNIYKKNFSEEDFALALKLWPNNSM